MWPTSSGDRTLLGSEAVLVANAIHTMVDLLVDFMGIQVEEDDVDECRVSPVLNTGISVYDSLAFGQRIAMLHRAARHLLTTDAFAGRLIAAVDDATIAAIYCEIRDRVEMEIDFATDLEEDDEPFDPQYDRPYSRRENAEPDAIIRDPAASNTSILWRRWVVDACCELLGDGPWHDCQSDLAIIAIPIIDWEDWIDLLASEVLWDRDFEFADSFLDAEPKAARSRRQVLGIEEDYFVQPAPDPTPAQVERMIAETIQWVRPYSVWGDDHSGADDLA